jgi:5,10-methylenetetrahydromethanopterin reductase
VRFSVRVNNDLSAAELTRLAVAAEESGFDQLWVSNDLFLRSAPAMIAATLQELSNGRFSLGIGAGSVEFLGWAGIDRPAPLATTAQSVSALRMLLGHKDVDSSGLPSWFDEMSVLRFPLVAPVPVYVGAMGPKMLHLAGAVADGALPLLYPPEHFEVAKAQVLKGLSESGRDPASFDLPACFWVSVSPDSDAGRAALAEKLAYYGPSISTVLLAEAGLTPADFGPAAELAQRGESAAALIDDRMLRLGIAGGTDDVVARCRILQALGAEHLSFGPPLGPDPATAVRLLGSLVLPALRGIG